MKHGQSDAKPSRLWLAIRMLGAVTMLTVLVWVVLRSPSAIHLLRSPLALVVSFACGLTAMLAFALRMRACLKLSGVDMRAGKMVDIHFRSMLFFFILPASLGQDASRAALIAGEARTGQAQGLGDRIRTVGGSILLDRVIGVSTLLCLGLVSLPQSVLFETARQHPAILGAGVGLLAVIGAAGGWRLLRSRQAATVAQPVTHPGAVIPAIAFSLLGQSLIILSVKILVSAAQIDVSGFDIAVVSTVSTFGQLIPVGLFGLNSGDAAAYSLYLSLGLIPEDAALPVMALYAQHVLAAFIGGAREIGSGYSNWQTRRAQS